VGEVFSNKNPLPVALEERSMREGKPFSGETSFWEKIICSGKLGELIVKFFRLIFSLH